MFPLDPNAPPANIRPRPDLSAPETVFRCNHGVTFSSFDSAANFSPLQLAAIRGGIAAAERHANRKRS